MSDRINRVAEAGLRRLRVPYVLVDEARRAMLPESPEYPNVDAPAIFWAVIYRTDAPNLLVQRGRFSHPKRRENMARWVALFGDGFVDAYLYQSGRRLVVGDAGGVVLFDLGPMDHGLGEPATPDEPPAPPAPPTFTGPTGLYGQPVAGGAERQDDLFGSMPTVEDPPRRMPRKGSDEWLARIYAPATAATPALF